MLTHLPSKALEEFFSSDLFEVPMLFDHQWIENATNSIEKLKLPTPTVNYPPHNIIRKENGIRLEFAVAGFSKDELKVYPKDGKLYVSGEKVKKTSETNDHYLVKNIATRKFEVAFPIEQGKETYKVSENGVSLSETGLLTVDLVLVEPEEEKVVYLPIN